MCTKGGTQYGGKGWRHGPEMQGLPMLNRLNGKTTGAEMAQGVRQGAAQHIKGAPVRGASFACELPLLSK